MATDGLFGTVVTFLTGGKIKKKSNDERGRIGMFTDLVVQGGLAHSHLFEVVIYYYHGQSTSIRTFSLFCSSTSIPALNVMTNPYRENETHYEVPYGYSHEPVTMNFYVDREMLLKGFFDVWHESIINKRISPESKTIKSSGNNRIRYMDDFVADIRIRVFDKMLNTMYEATLHRAWPKSVGNIDLSHQNTDIVNMPVQFVYERMTVLDYSTLKSIATEDLASNPLNTSSFPLDIILKAKAAAEEIMSGVSRVVEVATGSVNTLFGLNSTPTGAPVEVAVPAWKLNDAVSTIRDIKKLF
jgi:hypothetical protein